tara:strand:+ start:123 stop:716 length:594 start_codon:yes stop_codon:yes gene_type:complete
MIDNFIGVFDNALCKEHCEELIKVYDDCEALNYSVSRQSLGKDKIAQENNLTFPSNREYIRDEIFFNRIQPHVHEFVEIAGSFYKEYAGEYGILDSLASHRFYDSIKIQKTKPTEGYHVWHCEHAGRISSSRLLLVMCYLNDVEEGGETEFLYQSKRIESKQGRIVICPSGFTHTHRGNPPLKGNKYMINGWIEFDS